MNKIKELNYYYIDTLEGRKYYLYIVYENLTSVRICYDKIDEIKSILKEILYDEQNIKHN